ncbi:hypothetical protein J6590_065047 [Homalodisca vitripennis]|nr:hypothetical protein J6590_065047 [Homalodisca vitripennis]
MLANPGYARVRFPDVAGLVSYKSSRYVDEILDASLEASAVQGWPPQGTNGVTEGRHVIFERLKQCITARLAFSSVILTTLSNQHDMPTEHPAHLQIHLVNTNIEELQVCARHLGVHLLAFNKFGQQHFTSHGLQLRRRSKRLLVGRVLESVLKYGAGAMATEGGNHGVPGGHSSHRLRWRVSPGGGSSNV